MDLGRLDQRGQVEFLEFLFLEVGQRAFPDIGLALGRVADALLLNAPAGIHRVVGQVELGLDHLVVLHDLGPVDLLAQPHLPVARHLAFALDGLVPREDLVPAVLAVDKDDRLLGLEVVMRRPQRLLFLFIRAFRQLAQPCAQLAQDRAVVVGNHALLYRPAVHHQVAALALVNPVYANKFVNFHCNTPFRHSKHPAQHTCSPPMQRGQLRLRPGPADGRPAIQRRRLVPGAQPGCPAVSMIFFDNSAE